MRRLPFLSIAFALALIALAGCGSKSKSGPLGYQTANEACLANGHGAVVSTEADGDGVCETGAEVDLEDGLFVLDTDSKKTKAAKAGKKVKIKPVQAKPSGSSSTKPSSTAPAIKAKPKPATTAKPKKK